MAQWVEDAQAEPIEIDELEVSSDRRWPCLRKPRPSSGIQAGRHAVPHGRPARFFPVPRSRHRRRDQRQGGRHARQGNLPPEQGTGWHFHEAEFHISSCSKALGALHVRRTSRPSSRRATIVHQRPPGRIFCSTTRPTWNTWRSPRRRLQDLEVEGPCAVPPVTPWR